MASMRLWIAIALVSQLFAVTRSALVGSYLRAGNLKIEDVNNTVNASTDQQREQNRKKKVLLTFFRNLDDGDVTSQPVSVIASQSNASLAVEVTMIPAGAAYQLLPLVTLVAGSIFFMWEKFTSMSFDKSKVLEVLAAVLIYYISSPVVIFINNDLMNSYNFKFPVTIASMGCFSTMMFAQAMVWSGRWTVKQDIPTDAWFKSVLPVAVFGALSLMCGNHIYLYLPVSLIQILKATTLVITLCFGLAMGVEKFQLNIFIAVCVIALASASVQLDGTGVMDNGSLNMHFAFGLLLNACACCSEAARVIMTQVSVIKLNFQDSLYWSSRAMVGVNLVLILTTEAYDLWSTTIDRHIVWRLCASSIGGCILTLGSWWLTKLVGGLSLKVLANARNYVVVTLAVYIYSEPFTRVTSLCYAACIAAIFYYEKCRSQAASEEAAKK